MQINQIFLLSYSFYVIFLLIFFPVLFILDKIIKIIEISTRAPILSFAVNSLIGVAVKLTAAWSLHDEIYTHTHENILYIRQPLPVY